MQSMDNDPRLELMVLCSASDALTSERTKGLFRREDFLLGSGFASTEAFMLLCEAFELEFTKFYPTACLS